MHTLAFDFLNGIVGGPMAKVRNAMVSKLGIPAHPLVKVHYISLLLMRKHFLES